MVSLLGVGLIERFRTNLESQVFHRLDDVVITLEDMHVEIAECVVALLIVNP